MAKVVIDLERVKYPHCGLGQFSLHLGRALLAGSEGSWQPTFLLPQRCARSFPTGGLSILATRPWRKEAWQRWWRPCRFPWTRRPRFDLWHATHQDTRYWPLDPRTPVVLTIHDLNFLRTKSEGAIRRRLRTLQGKVTRARALTTGSEHAAREIREHLAVGDRPLRVIPHGVCLEKQLAANPPLGMDDGSPFLFTIGDIRRSKHFHVLVDMLVELPEWRLVIAGSTKDPYAAEIQRRAEQLGIADRLRMPGRVADEERMWLYQNCTALVFPSLAEGFGLPLIEAMHCGKPVFSSRYTSLPEVGGDIAFYWDDFTPEHMAQRVRAGLRQATADPTLPERSRARAAQFTWEQAARRYLALYREFALAEPGHS